MLKQISGIILFLILPAAILMARNFQSPADLKQYQWKNRLFLIFAPSEANEMFQSQIDEIEGAEEGFNDRNIKTFYLLRDGASQVEGEPITVSATKQLYKDYNVAGGNITVILVGKDGTEKLRTGKVIAVSKLFSVIDAMPMRKREMNSES